MESSWNEINEEKSNNYSINLNDIIDIYLEKPNDKANPYHN